MRNFDKVSTPVERIKEALQLRGMKQSELAATGIPRHSRLIYNIGGRMN